MDSESLRRMFTVLHLLFMFFLAPFKSKAQAGTTLPQYEVEAIREMAEQLNKKDWNFSDPACSSKSTTDIPRADQYSNVIICKCSISATECHIQTMVLESNLFSGTIPYELGQLNLEVLNLNANNLTGEFPMALISLPKLTVLRISGNNFTRKMPEFGNWKQLQKLEIEGSGFNGPIPSSLSNLNKLTELRISDLHGESSDFPDLRNMTNLDRL
ncbi:probable LRR receptor-like serine/threonine-protein kinase At1g53440 isoform X2 [Humulus lupulus]|uniref:probable LRR receptor-like serine/threonine-protein kinase At1g53440 isoform X2 n=1 Tax=Humulus lupulus TaxID=3486 RepID=UPI002B4054D7|nr:probable LRR receptor-like serine/threonine-protein kinase At1g53440 isoform X2 [Humulus lupulus]